MASIPRPSSLLSFFMRNNFRKEITLIIILKLLALFTIWGLFFSDSRSSDPLQKQRLVQHFMT